MKRKLNMKQLKLAVGVLVASSCSITLLMCYWNRNAVPDRKMRAAIGLKAVSTENNSLSTMGTPMRRISLNEVYADQSRHFSNESFELYDYKQCK